MASEATVTLGRSDTQDERVQLAAHTLQRGLRRQRDWHQAGAQARDDYAREQASTQHGRHRLHGAITGRSRRRSYSAGPDLQGPQPVCLQDCTSLERVLAECVADEQYRCPEGWVDLDSCPKDACARRSYNCCSPTGQREYPECADDGTIGECPAGFEQRSPCVPAGLGLENCDDIVDDSDCASEELICFKDRCGRNCLCEADLEGKLGWRCRVNAC